MRTKSIGVILLIFISFSISAQSWRYEEGSDPFDGKYRVAYVVGTGGDFPYQNPMLHINLFAANLDKPNIYLSDVPSSICDNKTVLIKFDNDPQIFKAGVSGSRDNELWFLDFLNSHPLNLSGFPIVSNDDIKGYNPAVYILEPYVSAYFRAEPNSWSEIIYEGKTGDTIRVLNFDTSTYYWLVLFNDYSTQRGFIGYVDQKSIPTKNKQFKDMRYNPKSSAPIAKALTSLHPQNEPVKETELDSFIRYIKTHKKMYVRMSSDCVSVDYEFSLSGSTAAMNYVFKK